MSNRPKRPAGESDPHSPIPRDSRYVPFTQQPSCCVPTCMQMVMYRNNIPLRPAEEIGYHLGLVVSPDQSNLFCNVRTSAERPSAGYGIRMHIPEFDPNIAFARMGVPLHFVVEPVKEIPSANDLLERLRTIERGELDALVAFNLETLIDDPSLNGAHHACVFDRIIDGRVRLIDPSFYAPKWRMFDVEQLFLAMQKHVSSDWGGIWLLTKTGATS